MDFRRQKVPRPQELAPVCILCGKYNEYTRIYEYAQEVENVTNQKKILDQTENQTHHLWIGKLHNTEPVIRPKNPFALEGHLSE